MTEESSAPRLPVSNDQVPPEKVTVTAQTSTIQQPPKFNKGASYKRYITMAGAGVCGILVIVAIVVGALLAFPTSGSERPVKIAAFNIKHFGRTKMSDKIVAGQITEIIQLYDVVLIQEVRDISHISLDYLWCRLNKTDHWGLVESSLIGRSKYKEQYVFFYKTGRVTFLESYQTIDHNDVYEREPFSAEFQYYSVDLRIPKRVVLMGLHVRPKDAVAELEALPKSIWRAASWFEDAGGVIALGDFNADCSYVSPSNLTELDIFTNSSFTSLIPHSADTTSGTTDCAYDRVVVYGNDVRARDAMVFDFQLAMGLNDTETAKISDHYPVEFQLY